jgi:predicted protein tyrosine phosphatase
MTKTSSIFEISCPYNNQYQGIQERWLYVCSAGMLRSATGATVASMSDINARSCGTSSHALIPLSSNLIHWAQRIIFVNEQNYYEAIETFSGINPETKDLYEMIKNKCYVMDIEDNYDYMNEYLVTIFKRDIIYFASH